jgi:transposase
MGKRKIYNKEFKLDAVSLVTEQGYSQAEAARSLGINANVLSRWIQQAKTDTDQSFRGNGNMSEEQREIAELKKRVKRLELEKEILKKATVFFAAETK